MVESLYDDSKATFTWFSGTSYTISALGGYTRGQNTTDVYSQRFQFPRSALHEVRHAKG